MRRHLASQAVRELLGKGGFKGRRVVTCLGSGDLSIKQVRLPRMPDHELRSAVQWEAQERFGFPVSPDQVNYLVAGEVRQGTESRDEIILLGVRAEQVDQHLAFLDEMNLVPEAIDAEPVCLFRALSRQLPCGEGEVWVLADVGYSATRGLIARGTELAFIKNIETGGRHLVQAVAEKLNLSTDEVSQLRQHLGAYDGGESDGRSKTDQSVRDALRGVVEGLVREIGLCLRYYAVTFRGVKPGRIVQSGWEARDPHLREMLAESLNIPCQIGHPLGGIDCSRVDLGPDPTGSHSGWAVAAGLALRGVQAGSNVREHTDEPDRLSA
jgi:type IV pilus assembly protein PilM